MHSTSEFAKMFLSKCVIHAGFVKVAWTLRGNACLSKELTLWIDLWIDTFEFRNSSKWIAGLFSEFHTSVEWMLQLLAAVIGLPFSLTDRCLHSLKPRQQSSFPVKLKRLTAAVSIPWHLRRKVKDMLSRCGHFLLVTLVRFICARNSFEHW